MAAFASSSASDFGFASVSVPWSFALGPSIWVLAAGLIFVSSLSFSLSGALVGASLGSLSGEPCCEDDGCEDGGELWGVVVEGVGILDLSGESASANFLSKFIANECRFLSLVLSTVSSLWNAVISSESKLLALRIPDPLSTDS